MKLKLGDSCLVCGGKFQWNERIILKYPEGALFHIDCCDKFPDEKVYNGENEGWMHFEWQPDLTLTNE